ncbi:MAG: hypothetical protein KDB86_05350 [Actinobacteria bacterium]|nr:hypothetical protein [Actinomycetota bacterium]MCB9390089.1 hypothetical protein [Acidimicrobiia bacterium]
MEVQAPRVTTFVGGLRVPWGAPGGRWAETHAVDLAAGLIVALRDREPGAFHGHPGRLHLGTATPLGELSMNAAQVVCASSGLETFVARTFEAERCGGQVALHDVFAFDGPRVVVSVDVETRMPFGSATELGVGPPLGEQARRRQRWPSRRQIADRYARGVGLDREAVDRWAYDARIAARQSAASHAERAVLSLDQADQFTWSRTPSMAHMTAARPLLSEDGVITAKNVAGAADGAVALVVSDTRVQHVASARVRAYAESAGPVESTFERGIHLVAELLSAVGFEPHEVDAWELDDTDPVFALSVIKRFSLDRGIVNPWGGALSSGIAGAAEPLRRTLRLLARGRALRPGAVGIECTLGVTGSVGVTFLELSS